MRSRRLASGIAVAETVAHALSHFPGLAVPASFVLAGAGAAAGVVGPGFAVTATGSIVATCRTNVGPRPAVVAARSVAGTTTCRSHRGAALRPACRDERSATIAA